LKYLTENGADMNYYNYSGKKSQSRLKSNRKKLIINIIIIILVITICVALSLILGNHLKHKLEEAELSTQPVEELITPQDTVQTDPGEGVDFVKNDHAAGAMAAVFGYLDLEGCPDEESVQGFVNAMKDNGYTGIVFNVRGKDGNYAFASKAASGLSRVTEPGGVPSYDFLNDAVNTASTLGMRSAAYIDLGDIFSSGERERVGQTIDRAVIKELSDMGFSEIIFDGITEDRDFTIDFSKQLYSYVSALREECPGTDFALVIDPAILENPEKTPPLEVAFRFIDLFALDLTNKEVYTPEKISEMLDKFSGSFSAYSLLTLLDGSDIESIRAGYEEFSAQTYPNIAFITPKSDYEPLEDDEGNPLYSSKVEKYSLTGDDTTEETDDMTEDFGTDD